MLSLEETKYFSIDYQNGDIALYEISTGIVFFRRYANSAYQTLPEFEIIKEYLNKICTKISEFDRYNYDTIIKSRIRKEKITIILQNKK